VEAAAFGVPTLGSAVGGLPTIVEHGVTGELLSPEATAVSYADAVERMLSVRERYEALAFAAYRATVTRLNWDVSVSAILDRIAAS
jgi:glycosyltransferase involved in cell wall biosynthesis